MSKLVETHQLEHRGAAFANILPAACIVDHQRDFTVTDTIDGQAIEGFSKRALAQASIFAQAKVHQKATFQNFDRN
jgi:hypothetical protein